MNALAHWKFTVSGWVQACNKHTVHSHMSKAVLVGISPQVYIYSPQILIRTNDIQSMLGNNHSLTLICSPLSINVLLWSGLFPTKSLQLTSVLFRSSVAVTVAIDVMLLSVTAVTLNWNGGSEENRVLRESSMLRDETTHWCAREGTVQVNITVSPGHGLSTLDCNWAPETEEFMTYKPFLPQMSKFTVSLYIHIHIL